MSRGRKIAERILSGRSDANILFDDLCHVLDRAGFAKRQGAGSHVIYHREDVAEILNLQPRQGKAKPYQVRQVRELLLRYKLEVD